MSEFVLGVSVYGHSLSLKSAAAWWWSLSVRHQTIQFPCRGWPRFNERSLRRDKAAFKMEPWAVVETLGVSDCCQQLNV